MLEHGKDFKRATAGISQPGTTVAVRQFYYQQRKGTVKKSSRELEKEQLEQYGKNGGPPP